jgi:hypothetical protein
VRVRGRCPNDIAVIGAYYSSIFARVGGSLTKVEVARLLCNMLTRDTGHEEGAWHTAVMCDGVGV